MSGAVRLAALLAALALLGCATSEEGASKPAKPAGGCEGIGCRLEELAREAPSEPWQVLEGANFRVLNTDPALAARIARRAEALRAQQLRRWTGAEPGPWSPRCDLYVYATTRLLSQMSGGPKAGSAVAQPGRLSRRLVSRRINLAADDSGLLGATLPHEISHLIVSELLAGEVPLWAHEGLATLEEPRHAQEGRARLAAEAAAAGQAFPVKTLMEMSRYPDQEYVSVFYAQASSVTRFLLGLGDRRRMLAFLREARPGALDGALRRHYGLSMLELQRRWLEAVTAERARE